MGEASSVSGKRLGDTCTTRAARSEAGLWGGGWEKGTGGLSVPAPQAESVPRGCAPCRPALRCRPIAAHAVAVRGHYWRGGAGRGGARRAGSAAGGAAARALAARSCSLRLRGLLRRPVVMAVLAALLSCSARGRGPLLQRLLQVRGTGGRAAACRPACLGGPPLAARGAPGVGLGIRAGAAHLRAGRAATWHLCVPVVRGVSAASYCSLARGLHGHGPRQPEGPGPGPA